MSCIAVWCTKTTSLPTLNNTLEVHFNLWKLSKQKLPNCFLDIGIMVGEAAKASHVNIFVPQPINASDLTDLGVTFRENHQLAAALFNEEYRVTSGVGDKILEVLDADRRPVFSMYVLDLQNDVTIEEAYGGSIVSVRIPDALSGKKHYYRIRLKGPFIDSLSHFYTPPNSWLESAFFQTELVDFRLNEKRNLNSTLLERMRSEGGDPSLAKTHFFLMREASDDYVFSHKPPTSSRRLEKDIWEEYVGDNHSFDRIIAYHWKEPSQHPSFSAFVKFRSLRCSRRTIAIFVLGVTILGIISSFIANLLFAHFSTPPGP